MLKILNIKSAKPKKNRVEISSNSRNEYDNKAKLDNRYKISGNKVNSKKIKDNDIVEEKNYQKTSKFKKW